MTDKVWAVYLDDGTLFDVFKRKPAIPSDGFSEPVPMQLAPVDARIVAADAVVLDRQLARTLMGNGHTLNCNLRRVDTHSCSCGLELLASITETAEKEG